MYQKKNIGVVESIQVGKSERYASTKHTAKEFIEALQQIPEDAEIIKGELKRDEGGMFGDEDVVYYKHLIYYSINRLETDEEFFERVKSIEAENEKQLEREKQQYLQLKAKFEK